MKAIRMHEPGEPEVLKLEDVAMPEPGTGEVLVEVALAGVNYADTGMRRGMFHGPGASEMPITPGFEVAGTVAKLGDGVEELEEGVRIVAVLEGKGYAEYAVVSTASLVKIPEGVDFLQATALLVQGITAHGVLHDSARIQPGESVLVQAAAGGVGTLAVQLAKLAGAEPVVGTASTEEKRTLAESLGAGRTVDYTRDGWIEEVLESTGGRGVDVVLESVGGEVGEQAYGCLAPLGRLVTFGAAAGKGMAPPDMWQLNMRGQTVSGYGGPWLRPGAAERAREDISAYLRSGKLEVVKGASFPLEKASESHRAIESRATVGKVFLTTESYET